MAEIALGIAGVVPLIGLAVKSYRQVHSKLKIFVHYSKTLKHMRKRLNLNRSMFELECHYLLRFAFNDKTIEKMKIDGSRAEWNDAKFEGKVRLGLGVNYEDYMGLVEDVSEVVEELSQAIDRCAADTHEGERLKDTLRRLKKRGKLAIAETEWEKTSKKLRDLIQDLTALREKLQGLKNPTPAEQGSAMVEDKAARVLFDIRVIRCASSALYHGLRESWDCSERSHSRHAVNLFMESLSSPCLRPVQLHLSIIGKSMSSAGSLKPSRLKVESQYQGRAEDSHLTPSESPEDGTEEAQPPRKRVKYGAETVPPQMLTAAGDMPLTPVRSLSPGSSSFDEREFKSFCLGLVRPLGHSDDDFLGYMDTKSDEMWRHRFYTSVQPDSLPLRSVRALSLRELFARSPGTQFSVLERLELALGVVEAAFTYHCTPWLKRCWRIDDFSLLSSSDQSTSTCLKTLHLGAEFTQAKTCGQEMEDVQNCSNLNLLGATEDELLYHGVGDVTLHSLGVSLLSIDCWTKFEPDDLLAVRKAARRSVFGPRYRDVVNKCLGYLGQDEDEFRSNAASGQERVFLGAMKSLQEMITSLSITDEDS
ncbi:hypothetical protein AK830_g9383 [Neonectria ditissima]|uniref:Uncharacterized protein n=1 Tax=Neonectria ditissima TaxID=78410 RepID=A0A0P7AI63_9HYPO|nr:hypothetical protein AK830_g9383 [Neonectria ditissima]